MNADHDLILLMKKHPELVDPSFSFYKSTKDYSKKVTKLVYRDNQDRKCKVYFFHDDMSYKQIGFFFDEFSRMFQQHPRSRLIFASRSISNAYKNMLDHFEIDWLEMSLSKAMMQIKESGVDRSISMHNQVQKSEYHNALIVFTEGFLRADLNTSWFDFSLLVSNQKSYVDNGDIGHYKERVFQIYYRDQLRYEGAIAISYEKKNEKLQWPSQLTIYLDEIDRGHEKIISSYNDPFEIMIDLQTCIDWKSGQIFTEIPIRDDDLSKEDLQRIEFILQRWNLHHNHSFRLSEFDERDIEYFTQKIISLSMLKNAAKKKTYLHA